MSDTFSSTDALLSVAHWDTDTITYSFYNDANSGPYYGSETGVSEISEKTKDNIRSIFKTLERYLDVDFREVADTATDYGLLRYMVSDGPSYAYAYLPNGFNFNVGNGWDVVGDVHVNQAYDTTGKNGFADDPGNHGYMTMIHETLHALGLKHPNPYEKNDYGPFLPFNEDNTTNTVMSYNFAGKSAITPMTYDIQALQSIYGAREYNHGDTTYSFKSVHYYTDGSEDYGATKPIKQTLWDSGGENTLDFSNLAFLNTGYHFDMNEGGIITTQKAYNGRSYKARTDDSGKKYLTSEFGTAIAFDTVIHNLINSSSDDYIIANSAANIFSGYEFGISTGDDIIEASNYLDSLDLSEYASSSVTQIQSGDNLILGLGSDSSITVKDYYTVSESHRLNIIFEEESPPPVLEKIIGPDTITNISKVKDSPKEPKPTNTAPTDISLSGNSVKEFSNNGTTIAKLTTKDVDSGDTHKYKLLDDADGRFKIDGNRLKVKDGSLIDFDKNSSHDIKIRTTDSGGKSYEETFSIKVENQNFAPTDISLSGNSVKEFSNNGTTIATLRTKDVDSGDKHTYKLLDDPDGRFEIDGNRLKVKDGSLLDFDKNSSHDIKIRTTDQGGKSYEETFSIKVENQNHAPTDITLSGNSVKELSKKGTNIGTLSTSDVDREDGHTYELLDDAQGRFEIVGNQLQVKDGKFLHFDYHSSHDIKIRTTGSGGKSYDKTFTIEVLNQNNAPTDISLSGNSVKEFSNNGTTIAKLTTKDVDWGDKHTYQLFDDPEGRFEIVGNELKVKDGSLLDFDNNSSHEIKIRTTDSGGKSYDKTFTIDVLNQNNAPTDITLSGNSVNEFSNNGTTIATLTTKDVDWGDKHTYQLFNDPEGRFEIVGNELKVKDGSLLDFDKNSSHDIKIRTTDQGGESYDKTFTIEVLENQNHAPTDITLSGNSVNEFSNNGTTIAKLTTKDVDFGDSHTYKLLDNAQGRFEIVEDQLKVKNGTLLDFDVNSSHPITIRTTDSGGESYDKTFTIEVLENQNWENLSIKGDRYDNRLEGGHGDDTLNGGSGDDSLVGGLGNDSLRGSWGKDTLHGGYHDDTLRGGHGDDSLFGGIDNDWIMGDVGNDTLEGSSGEDTLSGGSGHDLLDGGNHDDILRGGKGDDTLKGGSGNDYLRGDHGNDSLEGGSGNDTLIGASGDDSLDGGSGNDILKGTSGKNDLIGGSGNDSLDGGHNHDTLKGDSGNDTLIGGSGDDSLDGGQDHDTLKGDSGNDTLIGDSGNDTLDGGRDHDLLEGGSGHDYLMGDSGNDFLDGGQNHDLLEGGSGNDTLIGGDGNDTLNGVRNGSRGNGEIDVLVGGAGSDTFILGDKHLPFYHRKDDNDYAQINDLDSQDTIHLYGVADQYDLLEDYNGLPGSTALYFKDDLIAVFNDVSVSDVRSTMEFLS